MKGVGSDVHFTGKRGLVASSYLGLEHVPEVSFNRRVGTILIGPEEREGRKTNGASFPLLRTQSLSLENPGRAPFPGTAPVKCEEMGNGMHHGVFAVGNVGREGGSEECLCPFSEVEFLTYDFNTAEVPNNKNCLNVYKI